MRMYSLVAGVLACTVSSVAYAQDRFTGDLCGVKADVAMKPPAADANPELKKFYGVWGKGKWSAGTCNALVVSEVTATTATVIYYYGTGVDVPQPGSFTKTDATLNGKYLAFKSLRGHAISYELSGNQLKGWFGSMTTTEPLQKLK